MRGHVVIPHTTTATNPQNHHQDKSPVAERTSSVTRISAAAFDIFLLPQAQLGQNAAVVFGLHVGQLIGARFLESKIDFVFVSTCA